MNDNSSKNAPLTLTAYSTALFSSWFFCEELKVLFDCGDGVCSGLMQKSQKIKHVFLSHADRDHVAGLLQFNQLNGREGLKIYYPKDCGSFPALADFCDKFDPISKGSTWIPLGDGEEVRIREDLIVRAIRNRHVDLNRGVKSLSFVVEAETRKLKAEHVGKSGTEIARIRAEYGAEAVSDLTRTIKLIYSGDTPVEWDGRYDGAEVLIHEATFLTGTEMASNDPRRNPHSSLEDVVAMIEQARIQHLVLSHFSSRYHDDQIDEAIRHEFSKQDIDLPVYRVLPGKVSRDVMRNHRLL